MIEQTTQRPAHRSQRVDLLTRLVRHLSAQEAVVSGIGNTSFDLFAVGDRPANFYMVGSMGLACPIALGVALAQPARGVIAVEGDGSILMSLGCLATIASIRPANLTIIILDNQSYQITGGQPTATAEAADIVAIARGAGIAHSLWVQDEQDFERLIDRRFDEGGPVLLAAHIGDEPAAARMRPDPAAIKDRFMRGLGVRTE